MRSIVNTYRLLAVVAVILCWTSCSKEEVGPQGGDDNTAADNYQGVLILNEGNFGSNNASLSFYNRLNGQVNHGQYQAQNDKVLGDVLQSMTIHDGKGFLVVNNSARIEVVNMEDLKHQLTIEGFRSPRYFQPANGNQAYVTNFVLGAESNLINIIDLSSLEHKGQIEVTGWCEEMVFVDGHTFVANTGDNKILKIGPKSNQIVDELNTAIQPISLVTDQNDKLWALCTGGFNEGFPRLYQIDPFNLEIMAQWQFESLDDFPSDLVIDGSGATLYYQNGGQVFRMKISDQELPKTAWLDPGFQYLYALGVDPESGNIYLSDAYDFQRNGKVAVYDPDGNEINSFASGEGPGGFVFN